MPETSYRPRRRTRTIILRVLLILVLLGIAAIGAVFAFFGQKARQYDLSKLGEMRERSLVLDRRGKEIGRLHGENRNMVKIDKVSKNFTNALLAREDTRFYDHNGVDYIGVARALIRDVKEKKMVQGASTITMQLARNSFDNLNAKTAHRKLVEIMLARRIENEKTKDEILELYVNRIFFGTGIFGIERASRAYFSKPAADLSVGEGAMLAGIIRSPNRFSPFRNWEGALKERDSVLNRMVEKKFLTAEQGEAAKKEDMIVSAQPVIQTQENYMMEAVRRDLDLVLTDGDIEDGGLRIYTTLDSELQAAAEASINKRLAEVEKLKGYKHITKAQFDAQNPGMVEPPPNVPYLQSALMVIENKTGGILSVVGGRDYLQNRYDRALQSTRPIGSTIKPFIYAAGFMRGLLPGTLVDDSPIREGELLDANTAWSPENSDGKFLGLQPASVGLVRSRNTMTVRVGNYAGLDNVINLLRDAGLGEPEIRTPQVYIGNMGTTLKSLASAVTVFPNHGIKRRPFLIEHIEDGSGELIYTTPVLESEVLHPAVAQVTRRLMEDVMTKGTATAAKKEYGFKERAGGKTGTTNDYKDAWFVGFTSDVTCGVWVGLDQPQTIISGGYGGKISLPIWCDVMNKTVELNYKSMVPTAEPVLAQSSLCRVSGQLATEACAAHGAAYQDELPAEMVPKEFCATHVGAPVPQAQPAEQNRPGFFGRMFRWLK